MEKVDLSLLLIRIMLGIIFMVHGYNKLKDLKSWGNYMSTIGIPKMASDAIALFEFIGGLLICLGIFAKFSALGMIIFMISAIWLVHRNKGFLAEKGGYEYQLLIIVCCVVLVICGGGKYAIIHTQ